MKLREAFEWLEKNVGDIDVVVGITDIGGGQQLVIIDLNTDSFYFLQKPVANWKQIFDPGSTGHFE